MIKMKSLITEQYVYHVTAKKNIPSVKRVGITPSQPTSDEPKAVYLFPTRDDAEDALMNWLGSRFEEDEPLVLLTINPMGLNLQQTNMNPGYEVISHDAIPWSNIVKIEDV